MDKQKRIRRILAFVLITLLCLTVLYFTLDMPCFSAEMAMHREEAMHWVGPSRVIAEDEVDYFFTDHILIGETDYGYTLFEYSEQSGWRFGELNYHEKRDGVTCFTSDYSNDILLSYDGEHKTLPVYAIPEDAGAVTARLTLSACYTFRGEHYQEIVTAEADLRQDTFFLFPVNVEELSVEVRGFWMQRINGREYGNISIAGSLTVELFDRDGNLIETRVTEFPANP